MTPARRRDRSPSNTPVPSTEEPQNDGSQLPEAEWDAMSKVLNAIYDYRTEDGLDPSKLFHRKVNKRYMPDYYEAIKEPVALSTIKQKIHTRAFHDFAEFVRDFALIPHNAQVYNRPDSGAFQDALVVKEQLEKQLQALVKEGVVKQEFATLPYLGEIPTYEDIPMEDAEEENEEEEESDEEVEEEEEEEEPDLDDEGRPKKKRGRPKGSTSAAKKEVTGDDGDNKKARGRPIRLLTPTEARIAGILKALRRPKNDEGQLLISSFDRLPDKAVMPEYYAEIKVPMAYDILKRKVKRKKYPTLESFINDVNLMFDNAKEYNQDDSQIFKDAVTLQSEAARALAAEQAKPDESFADDEGKIPMPNGILHNGELYKVGDWVHVQNPNDLTKPIPSQIYRTYKNPNGQSMVNVCWYYRPEQTVHRFDKHFLSNEVVKTGRYRDHHVEEVEGKCFVMFYTRFYKGRPRGLPDGAEVYVCRDRYNEERHHFNTIKTWTSCLPDEVRDKDYEMDLFSHPRPMKKLPSPLAYLLKDDQKETDELPKPTWGADGAPPKIGSVHRRPRTDKDSPPPEPTPPPPPPKVEAPAPRPVAQAAPSYTNPAPSGPQQQAARPPSSGVGAPAFTTSQSQSYTTQTAASPATQRPSSTQMSNHTPTTPQLQATPRAPAPAASHQQPASSIPPNPATYAPRPSTASYRDPPPIEVYTLPEQANYSIPLEVREQYQRDDFGRVLFFTAPPVAVNTPMGAVPGHSVRYLAEKTRRADTLASKRREGEHARQAEVHAAKKVKLEAEQHLSHDVEALKKRALSVLEKQLAISVDAQLDDRDLAQLSAAQKLVLAHRRAVEISDQKRETDRTVQLGGAIFADDWDNRV